MKEENKQKVYYSRTNDLTRKTLKSVIKILENE